MGLISQDTQPPAAVAPPPSPAQPGAPEQQQAPAPGGTQEDYAKVVRAGIEAITDPEIMKKILGIIKSAPSPAQGLLQATAIVMKQLAEISKGTMPDAIKTPASKEIMGHIAKLAQDAGVIPNAAQALQQANQVIDQKSGGAPSGNFQPLVGE